jgi:transcriptional regulator
MYNPSHFEETDPAVLHALVRAHPLSTWVVAAPDGELLVNHVPFMLDSSQGEHGTLIGHVARANPVWRALAEGRSSVVVFQGPEAYITPSWYASKARHGKVVPTWNYAVVHVHGVPRAIEDSDALLALVTRLTQTHESARPAPWQVADAPADYIAQMLGAIVGIEIPLQRWEGKWKVSQNRDAADRAGVAVGLRTHPNGGPNNEATAMAALVDAKAAGQAAGQAAGG